MHRIRIVKEPSGETYRLLLAFAGCRCKSFSLVWRHQFRFDLSAQELANSLQPSLLDSIETSKWPGTELIRHKALVRYYQITNASLQQLEKPERLYAWRKPSFPEDLVFYAKDKTPWLVTISHEYEAWFEDSSLLIEEVRFSVPGIIVTKDRMNA